MQLIDAHAASAPPNHPPVAWKHMEVLFFSTAGAYRAFCVPIYISWVFNFLYAQKSSREAPDVGENSRVNVFDCVFFFRC